MINSLTNPNPRSPISDSRHGMVLLVVLGALALLSILAISFVSITRLERSVSRNYVDRTMAIMLAESGIEAAVMKIESQVGLGNTRGSGSMFYNPEDPYAPLAQALQPSFANPAPPPAGITGAVSGFVGAGTYIANGNFFKLKVEDESGKLNLNDNDNPMDPDDLSSGRLGSIIENLGELLYAADFGGGIGTLITAKIKEARNHFGGAFSSLTEVAEALRAAGIKDNSITENLAETRRLQNLFLRNVTLWSWRDPNTLKPQPAFHYTTGVDGNGFHQDPEEFNYPATEAQLSGGVYSETKLDDTYGDDIYMNSQFQHKGLKLEPRSPVNINTTSQELIKALLMGIQGTCVYEYGHESVYRFQSGYCGHRIGLSLNAMLNYPLLYDKAPQAMHLADRGKGFPLWGPRTPPAEWVVFWEWADNGRTIFPYPDQRRYEMYLHSDVLDNRLCFLGNGFGSVRQTEAIDENLAEDLSTALYDRIHSDQKPFGSWQEFKRFIYEYFGYYANYYYDTVNYSIRAPLTWYTGVYSFAASECNRDLLRPGLNRKFQADAVLANCCPNSDLNDFNPNATLFRFTDKNDLLHYTTEFCFESTGVFSISSEGYVAGSDSNLVARQEIRTVIKVFETARITTQAQFFAEPADTMIENQIKYFGNNLSSIQTAGMNSDIACSTWDNGSLTQSYPEPLISRKEDRIAEACYDGYVCLASNQTEDVLGGSSDIFRVSFNGMLDADEAMGDPNLAEDCSDPAWADHTEQPTTNALLFTAADVEEYIYAEGKDLKPGNLHVDGGYSEAYQTLMYHSINNFGSNNGKNGSLLFWLKPNFLPERAPRPRRFFSMNSMNKTHQDRIWCSGKTPPDLIGPIQYYTGGFALTYVPQGYYGFDYSSNWTCENYPVLSIEPVTYNRVFVFGYGSWGFGVKNNTILTDPVNTIDHRDLDRNPKNGIMDDRPYANYNFLGHRWNFVAMSWDSTSLSLASNVFMRLNHGCEPLNHRFNHGPYDAGSGGNGIWLNRWPIVDGIIYGLDKGVTANGNVSMCTAATYKNDVHAQATIAPIGAENFMRFGEYVRGMPNYTADATFDEILCLPNNAYSLNTDFRIFYEDGRYYNNSLLDEPATYTTGKLNPKILGALTGAKSFRNPNATLRSISWTLWWPDTYLMPDNPNPKSATVDPTAGALRDRNPDNIPSADMNPNDKTTPVYPDLPDPLWAHILDNDSDNGPGETWATDDNIKYDWDPITVDIELPGGSWLFADDSSYPNASIGETGISYAAGTKLTKLDGRPIRLQGDDGIRLRFFFNEKQDADKPLHESPILDDITITFMPGKPMVLLWQVIQN
ncbi:hypothetical protein ACFL54_01000 [Planctomycetota bacterium]